MKLLRTIPWFTRVLVGLFLVTQFAGMVSPPRANALPMPAADVSQVHYHHAQDHGPGNPHSGNPADACFFAVVLPLVIAMTTDTVTGEPRSADVDILTLGMPAAGSTVPQGLYTDPETVCVPAPSPPSSASRAGEGEGDC